MIAIRQKDGRSASVIICDVCKEIITDSGMALARFSRDIEEGKVGPVRYCHKGRCDQAAEKPDMESSVNLNDHLMDTCHNVGLTLEKMKEAEEDWHRWREGLL